MKCPHCCFACTEKGEDMSTETFLQAISLLTNFRVEDLLLTIGGGEPTLHPKFEIFLWAAIGLLKSSQGFRLVGVVTNGSVTKRALELAKLATSGVIEASLSYDDFHDKSMVAEEVVTAFSKETDGVSRISIRKTTYKPMPHGRALTSGIQTHPYYTKESCMCEAIFISPNGDIYQCGCLKHVVGNVNEPNVFLKRLKQSTLGQLINPVCGQVKSI